MEFFKADDAAVLSNPGLQSLQLLSPYNSESERVTITQVTIQPGYSQERHKHLKAEQIWIAQKGTAELLLADDQTKSFAKGDLVRFEEGDIHGLFNSGSIPFEYLAITSPPLNFKSSYQESSI